MIAFNHSADVLSHTVIQGLVEAGSALVASGPTHLTASTPWHLQCLSITASLVTQPPSSLEHHAYTLT